MPPDELHSPYYPLELPYSSTNKSVITKHMEYLKDNNVNVIVISWWGQCTNIHSTDTQGVCTDNVTPLIFEVADEIGGIWIAFHLEPYFGRSPASIRDDLEFIQSKYYHHSSLYRVNQRYPVYYVYDSYHIAKDQWRELLTVGGDISIRNTSLDGIFIGLWLNPHDGIELSQGGFDGIYTYFVADSTSYGANPRHWKSMCEFCHTHQLLCDLSVGPGYDDSNIRPWNRMSIRDRRDGMYYSEMWINAMDAMPDVSYNSMYEFVNVYLCLLLCYLYICMNTDYLLIYTEY